MLKRKPHCSASDCRYEHIARQSSSIKAIIADFNNDSYYWTTIVSTHGERDDRWSVGVHELRGHTQDKVAVRLFVR